MSISFNADEIFEMAEEIERNGAKFYRKAAEHAADAEIKKMLNDFAAMEEGHLATFAEMRQQLAGGEKEQITFDPEHEAVLYLQSMADAHGWEGKKSIDEDLTGNESPAEILRMAIAAEKESVAFYVGIKDLVSEKAGKDKVDGVIKEEMTHITMLNNRLASL